MTALVSIDTNTGLFRRYIRGKGGSPVLTHTAQLPDWDRVVLGLADFEAASLERWRVMPPRSQATGEVTI